MRSVSGNRDPSASLASKAGLFPLPLQDPHFVGCVLPIVLLVAGAAQFEARDGRAEEEAEIDPRR